MATRGTQAIIPVSSLPVTTPLGWKLLQGGDSPLPSVGARLLAGGRVTHLLVHRFLLEYFLMSLSRLERSSLLEIGEAGRRSGLLHRWCLPQNRFNGLCVRTAILLSDAVLFHKNLFTVSLLIYSYFYIVFELSSWEFFGTYSFTGWW